MFVLLGAYCLLKNKPDADAIFVYAANNLRITAEELKWKALIILQC